jgi:hypothetical protein
MFVNQDLNGAQQVRDTLNLVHDHRLWKTPQKLLGVTLGHGTEFRIFQIGIGVIGENGFGQCGLAGLAGPVSVTTG